MLGNNVLPESIHTHTHTQCTVYPLNCKRTADRPRKTKSVLFDSFSHYDPRSWISFEAEGLAEVVYARITASFFFLLKNDFPRPANIRTKIYTYKVLSYTYAHVYIYIIIKIIVVKFHFRIMAGTSSSPLLSVYL